MGVVDNLWGDGYVFPGGEAETLRLAKPLGLSSASSLLLLGAGAGGPACSVAQNLGVWVSGYEADAELAEAAADRIARSKLGRRAHVETWNPERPALKQHYYHHGLALEPLRGSKPEPALTAVALALKPAGQFVLVELVADQPLDPTDRTVARWAALERRDPDTIPAERTITRVLGRLGFDVRVTEDLSERHMRHALLGWRASVRAMEENRPSRRDMLLLVNDAELWLMRLRLFRRGALRLVRWHAISSALA
jgi:cyclopropane fatty-acyl-phospholipid synthase-like methyltransferase